MKVDLAWLWLWLWAWAMAQPACVAQPPGYPEPHHFTIEHGRPPHYRRAPRAAPARASPLALPARPAARRLTTTLPPPRRRRRRCTADADYDANATATADATATSEVDFADLAVKLDYSMLDGPGQHLLNGIFLGDTLARESFDTQVGVV